VGTGAALTAVLGARGGIAGGVTYATPGLEMQIEVPFILYRLWQPALMI
jgi:hypothetical protein